MRNEAGLGAKAALDAVTEAHGPAARWALLPALNRPACAARPVACALALRTLAARTTEPIDNFGGYFWGLFKQACDGALLLDKRDEVLRTRECEAVEVAKHETWIEWDADPPADAVVPSSEVLRDHTGREVWIVNWPEPDTPPADDVDLSGIGEHLIDESEIPF